MPRSPQHITPGPEDPLIPPNNLVADAAFVDVAFFGGVQKGLKAVQEEPRCAVVFFMSRDEIAAARGSRNDVGREVNGRPAAMLWLQDDGKVLSSPGNFSVQGQITNLEGVDYLEGQGSYQLDLTVGGLTDEFGNQHSALRISGVASGTSPSTCSFGQSGERVRQSKAFMKRFALSGGGNPTDRYKNTQVEAMMNQLYGSVVMQQIGHQLRQRKSPNGKPEPAYRPGEMFQVTFEASGTGDDWGASSKTAWAPGSAGGWIVA